MANKLVKGTLILSVATLVTKVIGSLFWAPFQNIAGDETVGLYRASFPFYTILLMVASAGIPITVSKFVAERLSREDLTGARRVLKAASFTLTISGLCFFSLLFFGADWISRILLNNPPTKSSLQMLAFAILIVPVMGAYRGYFQGHQQMLPTGVSQVVEQIIRVGTVIALTYWMVEARFSKELVAAGATAGAFAGAIGGLLVVLWYDSRSRKPGSLPEHPVNEKSEPLLPLAKEIIRFAIPISLASLVLPLIGLMDSISVPRLLMSLGLNHSQANTLFGIYSRGEPFVNVISTFSSSLTLALIPAISAHVAKKEYNAVKRKISQAWLMTLVIGLPASVGLAILARPLNIMMYKDDAGTITLAVLAFSAIFSTLAVTSSGILQGLGYNKIPVRHLFIGALVKVAGNLVFIPYLGIAGSALAMVIAYLVVCALNMWIVVSKTRVKISITDTFVKPLLCTLIMAGLLILANAGVSQLFFINNATRLTYALFSLVLCTFAAAIYAVALLLTGTIGEQEIRLLPMGNRLILFFKRLKLVKPSKPTISP